MVLTCPYSRIYIHSPCPDTMVDARCSTTSGWRCWPGFHQSGLIFASHPWQRCRICITTYICYIFEYDKGIFVCITHTLICNSLTKWHTHVLSQPLAIGLCQWHHQCCQDLGRQSLKCWSRACQHLMKTCSCLLQGLPPFFATQGVWTVIQGWCCTVPRVTKAVTGAIKASKLQED